MPSLAVCVLIDSRLTPDHTEFARAIETVAVHRRQSSFPCRGYGSLLQSCQRIAVSQEYIYSGGSEVGVGASLNCTICLVKQCSFMLWRNLSFMEGLRTSLKKACYRFAIRCYKNSL